MDAGGLGWSAGRVGAGRAVVAWWRTRRAALATARAPGPTLRVRAPGAVLTAEPGPGGGLVHCERSVLRVVVAQGGAVFVGWDAAGPDQPEPRDGAGAGGGACPPPDTRATLEPDTAGGWRVVSQRVLVTVGREGSVRLRTPGGVLLRHDTPPRWWEPEPGAGGPWRQRSRVRADARFLDPGGSPLGTEGRRVPAQLVVSGAGTHLVVHSSGAEGGLRFREGVPGDGSAHDRPGRCDVRMSAGPVAYWVLMGPVERAVREWVGLTGGEADGR
ncbi:hypothetical protein GCM10023347_21760 [Streptomyces chumphonensis]|uniref:Uncharacterized protein n=1 Tax=Streptomyces chumphonensis TaxID=1214925 RepID=A0A927EX25_9ACTN|nr:hypothetical protein [Streptomyces chumphonensis]MBD3930983.1 hypothetical protein [Streptomyces chumphonensis]